ncbi:alpha-soluble NSF attachment protein, partial [Clonorchis sinensis]
MINRGGHVLVYVDISNGLIEGLIEKCEKNEGSQQNLFSVIVSRDNYAIREITCTGYLSSRDKPSKRKGGHTRHQRSLNHIRIAYANILDLFRPVHGVAENSSTPYDRLRPSNSDSSGWSIIRRASFARIKFGFALAGVTEKGDPLIHSLKPRLERRVEQFEEQFSWLPATEPVETAHPGEWNINLNHPSEGEEKVRNIHQQVPNDRNHSDDCNSLGDNHYRWRKWECKPDRQAGYQDKAKHEAATQFVNASTAFKKVDPQRSIECINQAIEIYT